MKVLLLGGTGAIGTYLKDILVSHNIETFITSRSHRNSTGCIHYIEGNAHNLDFLTQVCKEKYDVIVDFMSYKTDEFSKRIDILLESTKQYIFISSSRVYANKEHPIKECSPRLLDVVEDNKYLQTDEYALTKARQENLLKKSRYRNYTIIRPYITYGDYRMQLGVLEKEEWLYRALKGRTVVFSKDIGEKITTMTNGHDVANGIYSIMGKAESYGEAYHITGNNLVKWFDVWTIYSKVLISQTGNKPKIKLVDIDDFLSIRSVDLKWQVLYDRLYDRDFDNSKIEYAMEDVHFVSLETGLTECLSNFLSKPLFKGINWKSEAVKDRITSEKTPIKDISGIKNKLVYIFYRFMI